jgi:hypothetical protein
MLLPLRSDEIQSRKGFDIKVEPMGIDLNLHAQICAQTGVPNLETVEASSRMQDWEQEAG